MTQPQTPPRSPWGSPRRRRTAWLAAAVLAACTAAQAQDAPVNPCGELGNAYGPFDYRKDKDKLAIVENSHFTPQVRALVRGVSGPIGAELDYALRAFPNHHPVLATLERLGQKTKSERPPGLRYNIGCYFERAVRFAPDDAVARMMFAHHLGTHGQMPSAVAQLEEAASLAGDNGFTHYNVGMVFAELGQWDRALVQAHKASALGFERPDLKAMLQKAGKWQEPKP